MTSRTRTERSRVSLCELAGSAQGRGQAGHLSSPGFLPLILAPEALCTRRSGVTLSPGM